MTTRRESVHGGSAVASMRQTVVIVLLPRFLKSSQLF